MFSVQTTNPDLHLTLAEPRYSHELFSLIDANRTHLKRWLGWLDHSKSPDDSHTFLLSCQQDYASKVALNTLMFYKSELIGTVGFNSICRLNHEAEIGYWLSQEFTGKGLMTSAVEKLLDIGFDRFGLNRVVIKVDTRNTPSRAIAQRLGFSHEGCARQASNLYGEFHNLEVFSLLKSEWLTEGFKDTKTTSDADS